MLKPKVLSTVSYFNVSSIITSFFAIAFYYYNNIWIKNNLYQLKQYCYRINAKFKDNNYKQKKDVLKMKKPRLFHKIRKNI